MSWEKKFTEICQLKHSEQAKFWLNGFWEEGAEAEKETVWDIAHIFIELDVGFPILYGGKMREYKENCDLDEMQSHVVLEKLGETTTAMALRTRLKALDIDNNKRMCLFEYLLDKYKKAPLALCNSPQGTLDPAELKAAEDKLEAAGAALEKAAASTQAAADALTASEQATAELKAAVADLEAQEAAHAAKIQKFEDKIADESTSAMKKAMAKNELAQLQAEDPMPIRKAKITQKAAVRKSEKAVKAAALAKEQADADQKVAEQGVVDAEEALAALKRSGGKGTPQGVLYWMEKTLIEKKKFMR